MKTDYVTRSQNSEDLIGIGSGPLCDVLERIHPDDRNIRAELGRNAELEEVTFRCLGPDGDVIWLATRVQRISPGRLIGISFDITELKSARDQIDAIANTDELTGLPNRLYFRKSLEDAISRALEEKYDVSLFTLDFDYFKDINDTFGHDAGDAFLKGVAESLKPLIAPGVLVARLSGDEFGVIAENLDETSATMLARKIARQAGKQVRYKDHALWAKVSVGMARCPEHASSPEGLIKAADIALFEAKNSGRNQVQPYTEKMGAAVIERARIVEEVSLGLPRGELVPFYQPQIDLNTGEITGFEMLARWHHPSRGLLSPHAFWSAFEDHRLSLRLTAYLFDKVMQDLRRLSGEGLDAGCIAFNVSNIAFGHPKIVPAILSALRSFRYPVKKFEIEVTEDVLFGRNEQPAIEKLTSLRNGGVSVALDDFGTGNASLSHLRRFKVDKLKIDKSFVDDFNAGKGDRAIIEGIIGISKGFGMSVTAEGVEKLDQAIALKQMGCDTAQGYFFEKPMSYEGMIDLLRSGKKYPL
ncbi:putative bifunctional diguanylate cyclase/phosphodiesterase [Martelella mediterranea]|uniref:putative bifunctional diguanylate cyclase/phosphodiesterase n=1 Tax=Martelella mediterranea TaxID=293089 RepID=UPI00140472F0|nr:GGDEF and EAL domain-containing protein [Martelella mediterranea]